MVASVMTWDLRLSNADPSWGIYIFYTVYRLACFADLHLPFYLHYMSVNFCKVSRQTFKKPT